MRRDEDSYRADSKCYKVRDKDKTTITLGYM